MGTLNLCWALGASHRSRERARSAHDTGELARVGLIASVADSIKSESASSALTPIGAGPAVLRMEQARSCGKETPDGENELAPGENGSEHVERNQRGHEMNDEKLDELVHELRRLNNTIEGLFGLPAAAGASNPLVAEVQALINDDEVLRVRGVWVAADNTGQVHLCIRTGFLQPPTTFPISSAEEAQDYMRGMRRRA